MEGRGFDLPRCPLDLCACGGSAGVEDGIVGQPGLGEPFHVELRLSPGPDATDIVQIVDISEARFRQQALQDREAHYRRLNDIAQEAIVQVKDDVVLDVNSRFLAMLGWSILR